MGGQGREGDEVEPEPFVRGWPTIGSNVFLNGHERRRGNKYKNRLEMRV